MRLDGTLLRYWVLYVSVCAPLVADETDAVVSRVDFEQHIAPIFQARCIQCHDPGLSKGDLSMHTAADLMQGDYIVPGKPDESYLIDLVSNEGGTAEMPAEGEPLTTEQVELLRLWIQQGAPWPEQVTVVAKHLEDVSWWSLQPLQPGNPPLVDSDWPVGPIDHYVLAKLHEVGLSPSPPAARRALIRRVTYDLTGLPPTPQEVAAFLADERTNAYVYLIDRLLESPRYGEKWGRHWLDIVRFGESTGYERNVIINDAWPFRDYIIDAFNRDQPMSELIREHLAGDAIPEAGPEQVIGSAFLVNGPYDNVGNQDAIQQAQIRADTIDEMIRTTSEAFLGLTVGCARCHDHKFDPVSQRDYYRMYATFAGVKHGSQVWASDEAIQEYYARRQPLLEQQSKWTTRQQELQQAIEQRGAAQAEALEAMWTRPAVDRRSTVDEFEPVLAKTIRLVCEARDDALNRAAGFRIDEFEIWEATEANQEEAAAASDSTLSSAVTGTGRNVARLPGTVARGASRSIEDFPGAYGPQLAIDGQFGARFISAGNTLEIELPQPMRISGVRFSSARDAPNPELPKFAFVAEYRIEVSADGEEWVQVADGADRLPIHDAHRNQRLATAATPTTAEQDELHRIKGELGELNKQLNQIPPLPTAWIGSRDQQAAQGPFHVFRGGSPQKKGAQIFPASLSVLEGILPSYRIEHLEQEAERRRRFAEWITSDENALALRVLANRIWQWHFGNGIVSTPSDFGAMGQPASHPELLDYLAMRLKANGWRIKDLHREILLSSTYRQASGAVAGGMASDADSRTLWRFPPRRLAAEEIRDSMLSVAGLLDLRQGGPGFRLYKYLQDNVATYVPLDEHGPETYRRAVYHQNARASVVDLMTEYDQPDCTFSSARRTQTTTPLQALTSLNHRFTMDVASAMARKLEAEEGSEMRIHRAFELCFARPPSSQELVEANEFLAEYSLAAYCRVLLNTSEFLTLR